MQSARRRCRWGAQSMMNPELRFMFIGSREVTDEIRMKPIAECLHERGLLSAFPYALSYRRIRYAIMLNDHRLTVKSLWFYFWKGVFCRRVFLLLLLFVFCCLLSR